MSGVLVDVVDWGLALNSRNPLSSRTDHRRTMAHWSERLFQEQAAAFAQFFERRFDQAEAEVEQLLQLVGDTRGVEPERILDVACGTGRHVLAFADDGCDATGLDFSEEFIARARDRASERGLTDRTEFRIHDMRDLDGFDGKFDLITSFWNSLGYYDKPTDVGILTEMNRLLTDEGIVAIEMSNKEFQLQNFETAGVRELDETLHVERREFDVATGRFRTTIDVFSIEESGYDYVETMEFEPRLYAPVELKEMCDDAGFEQVSLFGDFEGGSLSLDASTVVVLAE
jgi:ubiquinone/menaquinone biosynthesis C-methylase UbiE